MKRRTRVKSQRGLPPRMLKNMSIYFVLCFFLEFNLQAKTTFRNQKINFDPEIRGYLVDPSIYTIWMFSVARCLIPASQGVEISTLMVSVWTLCGQLTQGSVGIYKITLLTIDLTISTELMNQVIESRRHLIITILRRSFKTTAGETSRVLLTRQTPITSSREHMKM